MREQTLDFPKLENKNNFVPDGVHDKETRTVPQEASQKESLKIAESGQEFFTSFAYCQALLFKSWLEASDKLSKRIETEKKDRENSEIPSLYIDIYEEVFTNLFKSTEYASNLGRMINSSMSMMKNWKTLAQNNASTNNHCLDKNKP